MRARIRKVLSDYRQYPDNPPVRDVFLGAAAAAVIALDICIVLGGLLP